VLALTAPAAVAIVWGICLAPKRRVDLPKPLRFAIELGVFAVAAVALWDTGQETVAIVLAAAALASGSLNYLWGEESAGPGPPPSSAG
jgi:anti-sigma-K factor RskA